MDKSFSFQENKLIITEPRPDLVSEYSEEELDRLIKNTEREIFDLQKIIDSTQVSLNDLQLLKSKFNELKKISVV